MKILSVMGSPRKGNSLQVVQKVETVLKSHGNVEMEYVYLGEMDIHICMGCCTCFVKEGNQCPFQDDVNKIVEKMLAADGVIFATPTYSMGMTSLMKAFIDRISYISHRACFYEKEALLVNTSSGMGIKSTLKGLEWPISSFGFHIAAQIGIATKTYDICQIPVKYNKIIDRAAKEFYCAVKDKKYTRPKLLSFINFKCLQSMYLSAAVKGYETGDILYWKEKGWLDRRKNYYIDIRGAAWKVFLARMAARLVV